MKRIFTLMTMILLGVITLNGQTIHYLETFDNQIPADYKTYDVDGKTPASTSTLIQSTKGKGWVWTAGGNVISTSWYNPAASANDWLVTKGITIPAASAPDTRVLLVWAEAKSNTQYPDGYEVYVSETDQQVASFTTKLLTVAPAETYTDFSYRTIDLSAYAGKTVYFAFRNNSYDGEFLYLDDIGVIEFNQNDITANRINNVVYNKENSIVSVNGTVVNRGWAPITEFKFNYQVDSDPVQSVIVNSLSIAPLASGNVASTLPLDVPFGKHTILFWPTDVNGSTVGGDTVSMEIYGYGTADEVTRLPLYEDFTSSTCPPCVQGNITIKAVFGSLTPAETPILIKYQQDFPGNGDPYVTNETRGRLNYYNIPGIPNSIIDGNYKDLNPQGLLKTDITSAFPREALATFDLQYENDTLSHSMRVFGSYTPTVDMIEGTRLMFVIKEGTTYKNVGTNGETVFDNVVKKMVPNQDGFLLDGATAHDKIDFDVTYTFPGTYRLPINGLLANRINVDVEHSVEEFSDLTPVLWIENTRDHYVLNAVAPEEKTTNTNEISSVESFKVFPNPSRSVATLAINLREDLEGMVTITDINGRQVWSAKQSLTKGTNNIDLPVVNTLAVGTYTVMFRSGNKIAIQELSVQ